MAATDDYDAIAKVIETYIEGAKTGDVGLMFPIFHEKAQLFGEGPPPGKRWDLDRDAYLEMQAKEPLNKGGKYRARLVSVKQMGPSAVAVVEEDGCWEDNVSFVDIFSLSRIDGAWKIVNKTYTHRDAVNATKATQEASAGDAHDEDGKKLPDKRPDMSWRDHLVMLLTFGATAEHCLMVQYLYAAYSLKVESSDPPERRQLVENWRHNILAVAREEMGHLLTVQKSASPARRACRARPRQLGLGAELLPVSVFTRAPHSRYACLFCLRGNAAYRPGQGHRSEQGGGRRTKEEDGRTESIAEGRHQQSGGTLRRSEASLCRRQDAARRASRRRTLPANHRCDK